MMRGVHTNLQRLLRSGHAAAELLVAEVGSEHEPKPLETVSSETAILEVVL